MEITPCGKNLLLLWGPSVELYENIVEVSSTWNEIKTKFKSRFSDTRKNFCHRMEVEHCIRRSCEEIQNFFHGLKRTEDEGWLDVMSGFSCSQQNAKRKAQGRQTRQRFMDNTVRGLRRRYFQLKALDYLMEPSNATWKNFSIRKAGKNSSFQVTVSFLKDEQNQNRFGHFAKNTESLQTKLQTRRINAAEVFSKPVELNRKVRQRPTSYVIIGVPLYIPQSGVSKKFEKNNKNEMKLK